MESVGKCIGQTQAMVGLADKENAGVGGNARGLGAKLHGRVE
jgi:hypothetical protein